MTTNRRSVVSLGARRRCFGSPVGTRSSGVKGVRGLCCALVLLASCVISPAAWGKLTVTNQNPTENTGNVVKGTAPPNTEVTIKFTTTNGITDTARQEKVTSDGNGDFKKDLGAGVKTGTSIKVSEPGGCTSESPVTARLCPPANTTVTTHVVQPGSSATIAGNTFALAGGFTAMDDFVDYDPLSLTYGDLSGIVTALVITGTGAAGTIELVLNADQRFTVNLVPVWSGVTPTIAFNVPVDGTAIVNASDLTFSGSATGTVTFFDDGSEALALSLNLTSAAGPITGTISSTGIERLVPDEAGFIPPPSAATCESRTAYKARRLLTRIVKCHRDRANGRFPDDVGEEACEDAAATQFLATTAALKGCPQCLDPAGMRDVAQAFFDVLNGNVFCDDTSGMPLGGDDEGWVPATDPIKRCEDRVGRAVGNLVHGIIGCHRQRAAGRLDAAAVEACEEMQQARFDSKTSWMTNPLRGCPPCVVANLAVIKPTVEQFLDAFNGFLFCEPSAPNACVF